MRIALDRAMAVGLAGTLLLASCGDRERPAGGDTGGAPPADAGAPAAGGEGAGPAGGAGVPAEPTKEMIARGDEIFHGRAANGTCFTCHGQNAEGGPLAPKLTDQQWLHTDGSMQQLVDVISKGVPQPKEAPAPMPPMGGANLTRDDLIAVAGYVYSLSHR